MPRFLRRLWHSRWGHAGYLETAQTWIGELGGVRIQRQQTFCPCGELINEAFSVHYADSAQVSRRDDG